ncbi:hypothetical protein DICVIV_10101 [Dictyocaulus viviparus]|uniref:Acyltransferase C-terminal domain-containing protein n=1 Tax=Dictyocaulus viviparus TaxID=29172 RepID=A0A0D8XJ75_DICVI|nr:hypothetical protein DICVIV_10101 [Dictyocaulus viviparus]
MKWAENSKVLEADALVHVVVLFPEGTDKSPWTTTKSLEYAKKNGLKELKHLLYPRIAANFIKYVYDITIAYPYNIVQSEVDLIVKGDCPREVHFHVKKIPVNDLPRTETDCARWLTDFAKWLDRQPKRSLTSHVGDSKEWYSTGKHESQTFFSVERVAEVGCGYKKSAASKSSIQNQSRINGVFNLIKSREYGKILSPSILSSQQLLLGSFTVVWIDM